MSPTKIVTASLTATLKPLALFALIVALGTAFPDGVSALGASPGSTGATGGRVATTAEDFAPVALAPLGIVEHVADPHHSSIVTVIRAFAPAELPMSAFGDGDEAAR